MYWKKSFTFILKYYQTLSNKVLAWTIWNCHFPGQEWPHTDNIIWFNLLFEIYHYYYKKSPQNLKGVFSGIKSDTYKSCITLSKVIKLYTLTGYIFIHRLYLNKIIRFTEANSSFSYKIENILFMHLIVIQYLISSLILYISSYYKYILNFFTKSPVNGPIFLPIHSTALYKYYECQKRKS